MRILVLSDIHSNWPALAAIDEPHDVCLVLGDLVDYGPEPSRCVRWAMDHAHHAIRGNHDHGVAQGVPVEGDSGYRYLTRISRAMQWPSLDAEERRYLLRLPVTSRLTIDNKRFHLVHATPRDPLDEYVKKEPEKWARRLANVEADIVCVGHTHMQFNLLVNGVVVLNPGSVGQPRDGDPRASYAIIDDGRIELKRVAYPIEETIARIEALDWPERAKTMMSECLRRGRLDGPSATATAAPTVDEESSSS
jgi:putative phosphoesterase